MQVLKKIGFVLLALCMSSCGLIEKTDSLPQQTFNYQSGMPQNMVESTDYSNIDLGNEESFRVAMLLPLSGNVSDMGQNMKNAAMMAVGDVNNNHLVVQFYDTKGTTSGARIAAENAINAKSDLIVGPLLGEEVAAISDVAKNENIPVISFSTAPNVLQNGVYTMGLLNEEQIERIIRYAVSQGRLKLVIVLPDSQSGINMFKAAMNAAQLHGATIVKVGFYSPNTMDFTKLVTQMAGDARVSASQRKIKSEKGEGKKEEEIAPLDFDALLVPEFGNRLKSITSMFSYYDVSAPEVLFLGTSVWGNTNLSKETELYGAVYPVMSMARLAQFKQKYYEMFNARSNDLSIFAYDAVALSSALSYKDRDDLQQEITSIDGFYGLSGAFRIFANGKNEHGLDIVKVSSTGPKLLENAPNKFYTANPAYAQNFSTENYMLNMPQVYGKNAEELQQILLNVQ